MSSVTIPWRNIVQRADPNWERDQAREPQYEFRGKTFYADSRRTGIYSPQAPAFIRPPVITGPIVIGGVLRCIVTPDMVLGSPEPAITYQWAAGGVELDGETDFFLATQSVDEGETFTCEVTLTNAHGSVSLTASFGPLLARFDFEFEGSTTVLDSADTGDLVGTFRLV